MSKKLTIGFIKEQFEKESYTLLTEICVNNQQKLNYICPNGHEHSISWGNWKTGYRCPYCANNVRLTIEFIKNEFKKEGYKLLTKVYKNSKQKLDYLCPKGHQHSIKWNNWQQGDRCYYCYGNVKLTIEFIEKEFNKEGYNCCPKVIKTVRPKLNMSAIKDIDTL